MAKGRVAVLEVHAPRKLSAAKAFCGTGIAEIIVKQCEARRIGKRLIQMVRLSPRDAIKQAKAARDAAIRAAEVRVGFFDGPLGVGNLLPFAKPRSDGAKLHYEIPMAGDRSLLHRHGLYHRRDEYGVMQVLGREISVSSRSLFSQQVLPA